MKESKRQLIMLIVGLNLLFTKLAMAANIFDEATSGGDSILKTIYQIAGWIQKIGILLVIIGLVVGGIKMASGDENAPNILKNVAKGGFIVIMAFTLLRVLSGLAVN